MCGIIGYHGDRRAVPVLLKGLRHLEYRGYDSSGIAVLNDTAIQITKKKGHVDNLESHLPDTVAGTMGIGHTRWATHGEPNDLNAHPHTDSTEKIVLVHNGVIENHRELRIFLQSVGRNLKTKTDTEVLVEYISYVYDGGNVPFAEAVRKALIKVTGTYGIVVLCVDEPDVLVAARLGSPLVLGIGDGEMLVASDAAPIMEYTRNVVYLEDGEIAIVRRDTYEVHTVADNTSVDREQQLIDLTIEQIEKGAYPHFMLKEIMEQAKTIPDAVRGRIDSSTGKVVLRGIQRFIPRILEADSIYITACGTSWHAALIGSYLIETLVGIPARAEYASEFRYRDCVITPRTVVIAISQSGETADTLAAVRKANEAGAFTLGVVNVVGSTIARQTQCGVFIHAGPEIGVASTKAFTSQLTILTLIALCLAQEAGMSFSESGKVLKALRLLSKKIQRVLNTSEQILRVARQYQEADNFLYLGRGFQFPVALEGALKLKEISYIHAEGYPAAEMKHGPIALIDEKMPVVVLALHDSTYSKVLSNIQEIKSRRGRVIAITDRKNRELSELADEVLYVPVTHHLLQPIVTTIPLQLLAYHIAVLRGCEVDRPRNLAKSVTVE